MLNRNLSTWFYSEDAARRVADRISNWDQQYETGVVIANAREVLRFLLEERTKRIAAIGAILESSLFEPLTDLTPLEGSISFFERTVTSGPWALVSARYAPQSETVGTVVNSREFGVFVEIEPGVTGLIHSSRLPLNFSSIEHFSPGERIVVKILNVNSVKRRMELAFVAPAVNEQLSDSQQLTLEIPPLPEEGAAQ